MIHFDGIPGSFGLKKGDLGEWLRKVAHEYKVSIRNLNYRFVDDEEIARANKEYLNHDYPTDIITFGYSEGNNIEGDVLIGYETVGRNSETFQAPQSEEMCRVIVHGLLHLIGYNDHSEEEKRIMRNEEEKCLILRPKNLRNS